MSAQTPSPGKSFTAVVQQKHLTFLTGMIHQSLFTMLLHRQDVMIQSRSQTRIMYVRSIAAGKSLNEPLEALLITSLLCS